MFYNLFEVIDGKGWREGVVLWDLGAFKSIKDPLCTSFYAVKVFASHLFLGGDIIKAGFLSENVAEEIVYIAINVCFQRGEGLASGQFANPCVTYIYTLSKFICSSICNESGHVGRDASRMNGVFITLILGEGHLAVAGFGGFKESASLLG